MNTRTKDEAEKAFDQYVGDRVRAIREERGLTQAEVADALGFTRATMNAIETGRSGASSFKLVRIAKVLGCRGADLVPPTDDVPVRPPQVTVQVRTRHPEDYELINHADGTRWRISSEGQWVASEMAGQCRTG